MSELGDHPHNYRLPPTAREVRVLRLFTSGMTHRQIGERLGISRNTSKVTLFHARQRLASAGEMLPEGV